MADVLLDLWADIEPIAGLILAIWSLAAVTVAAWIAAAHRRTPPIAPADEDFAEIIAPHFIRVNRWEFIPWTGRNDFMGDRFFSRAMYLEIRRAEIEDKNRRAALDYQRFMAALCEDEETQEMPVVPDEGTESIDDLYRDIGGEG